MQLLKGINLGGFLSQCIHSPEHYQNFITEDDIKTIASWGFDHVRLPIDYEVLEDESGSIKQDGFNLLFHIVSWCSTNNLNIILDLHKAFGYDFNHAGNAAKNSLFSDLPLQDRFITLWKRIATAFGSYNHVALELLNEVVEEENAEAWNSLIKRTVDAIREITTDTPIIYGGIQWNSAKTVQLLEKPQHENIIFTFHFYEPLLFTHQKAYWVPTMDKTKETKYPDTMEVYKKESALLGNQGDTTVKSNFDNMGSEFMEDIILNAIRTAQEYGISLYCGEFGVIDQAPVQDTLLWFKDLMKVFNKYEIGFALWTYKEKDFGLIDKHYDSIRTDVIKTLTGITD